MVADDVVVGVVVVDDDERDCAADEAVDVCAASSSASLAVSAFTVDCAEETDSFSAVASRVPRVCPAVTCWPTLTATDATCPATWNDADASLTGSTVPTRARL